MPDALNVWPEEEEEEKTLADRLITLSPLVRCSSSHRLLKFAPCRYAHGGLPSTTSSCWLRASLQSDAKRRGKTDIELRFDLWR